MSSRVASLRSLVPFASGPFVVRGVVPVPTDWSDAQTFGDPRLNPPELVARLGARALETQVEAARWDARGEVVAVEVSALVPPDVSGLAVGAPFELELHAVPNVVGAGAFLPARGAALDVAAAALSIHAAILDGRGNRWSYSSRLARDNPALAFRVFRSGPLVQTLEFSGRLEARDALAPFPRLFGFSAWLTWRAGEETVEVTLALDSGQGAPALPDLDLIGLELQVPSGIELEHKGPELEALAPVELVDGWAHPLLEADRREVWLQRQERVWRFALFASGLRPRARALLDNAGWAVPAPGPGLWSWSNRALCGYLAQGVAAPDLGFLGVGPAGVPGASGSLAALLGKLAAGAPIGAGNSSVGRLGLWHPWGVPYGGMTGGSEIDQLLGVELAAGAPDPRRLLEYQLRSARLLDRHRVALFDERGRALELETLARPDGSLPYVFNGLFQSSGAGADPLGFAAANAAWTRPAGGPAHEAALEHFAPIDEQHLVRFLGPWKVLAALDRDPHAIRVLSLAAELVRGHLSERVGGTLRTWLVSVHARPRNGGPLGRGEGWDADAIAQAWIYRRRPWRLRFADWAKAYLDLAANSPTPAGVWLRHYNGKSVQQAPFNSQHSVAQTIEHGIVANGVLGLWRATDLADPFSNVERALVEAASSGLRYLWAWGATDAWQFAAVGPIQVGTVPYAQVPPGLSKGSDSWQIQNLLGYGLELATARRDGPALSTIQELLADWTSRAPSALAWVEHKGWSNLHNRAALLSALQAGLST